ncbi:MAG: hypothetical protein WAM89_15520 [Terriglobales bacterium]
MRTRISDSDTNCTLNNAPPLIVDLMGPFVVQFQEGSDKPGRAIICAPLCVDHHANLLTDSGDISLWGNTPPRPKKGYPDGWVYKLCDDNPIGATRFQNEPDVHRQILKVNYAIKNWEANHAKEPLRIDPADMAKKCHFVVIAPMPDRITPLRPEAIWIHRNGADIWVTNPDQDQAHPSDPSDIVSSDRNLSSGRARGLRLFYDKCSKAPTLIVDRKPKGEKDGPDLAGLCAVTRFPAKTLPPYYSMTLQFAALHASASDSADDAYTCFQEMRKLFDPDETTPGEFSKWRVDFSSPCPKKGVSVLHKTGDKPYDCAAGLLAMQDWSDSNE